MKTEVYSWRVSTALKTGLERAARRRKMPVSAILGLAAQEWLDKADVEPDGDEEQSRLHKAAAECLGSFASGDTHRSENARNTLRKLLRRRNEH